MRERWAPALHVRPVLLMAAVDIFDAVAGDFQLTCRTDRLAPEVQDGDTLFVRPAKTVEAGQIAVVHQAGAEDVATVVRWSGEGRVIGRVIGIYRSLAGASENNEAPKET